LFFWGFDRFGFPRFWVLTVFLGFDRFWVSPLFGFYRFWVSPFLGFLPFLVFSRFWFLSFLVFTVFEMHVRASLRGYKNKYNIRIRQNKPTSQKNINDFIPMLISILNIAPYPPKLPVQKPKHCTQSFLRLYMY
jgi:hypothetical protein